MPVLLAEKSLFLDKDNSSNIYICQNLINISLYKQKNILNYLWEYINKGCSYYIYLIPKSTKQYYTNVPSYFKYSKIEVNAFYWIIGTLVYQILECCTGKLVLRVNKKKSFSLLEFGFNEYNPTVFLSIKDASKF